MSVKKLRDYQQKTQDAVYESFKNGISRQLIVLATGLGKTFTSLSISQSFIEYFERTTSMTKVLFLVDQVELAEQTYKTFKEAFPKIKVGIEQASNKINPNDRIVIASVQTIGRKNSKRILKFDKEQFGVVIVDEAHKSVADTFIRVLDYFAVGPNNHNPEKLLLAMTATPNRTDGVKLGKLYDDIVVNYDLAWGIRNGWLTDIEVYNVKTNTDISKVKSYGDDFAQGELNEAINNAQRNAQIVQAYKQYAQNERAFVYCTSVEHAYELEALFKANDVSCGVIEANTDKALRKKMLDKHKKGDDYNVLLNFGTLTTGVDSPKTACAIIARPIKSELLYRQIIGRVLRPDPTASVDEYSDDAELRRFMIEVSKKPAAKIIDFEDVTGKHQTMSAPSLFGLSRKIAEDKPRFFKDVVEVIEAKEHELGVNLKFVEDLSEIDVIVERRKGNLGSLETPVEIHDYTDKAWMELGEDHYELTMSSSGASMIIVKNQLDQYEVRVYDHRQQKTVRLQAFNNLSGAFKLADDYSTEHYDTRYLNRKAEWRGKGVTPKQAQILTKMLKGGIRVSREDHYPDTGVPMLYYKGELLNCGSASTLMGKLFERSK